MAVRDIITGGLGFGSASLVTRGFVSSGLWGTLYPIGGTWVGSDKKTDSWSQGSSLAGSYEIFPKIFACMADGTYFADGTIGAGEWLSASGVSTTWTTL